IAKRFVIGDNYFAICTRIKKCKRRRGAFAFPAQTSFTVTSSCASSQKETGCIITHTRDLIDRVSCRRCTIRWWHSPRRYMTYIDTWHMNDFIACLLHKIIGCKHHYMPISVQQALHIGDQRPQTAQSNKQKYP